MIMCSSKTTLSTYHNCFKVWRQNGSIYCLTLYH